MPLRLLDYVTQIYKVQLRKWSPQHSTFDEFRLQPVLPLVLYTGERAWSDTGTITGLIDSGELFAGITPSFSPLFFNLSASSDQRVRETGGAFGAVLRLYRDRHLNMEGFRSRLSEVVREIAELPQQERLRWLELLSYIDAFVYHVRNASEHPELIGMVEASAATDEERRAIMAVEMTMATYHREQAVISANQETLIRRFRASDLANFQWN